MKKWLLATSEYRNEIQDLNAIVVDDEKFNAMMMNVWTQVLTKIGQFWVLKTVFLVTMSYFLVEQIYIRKLDGHRV